MEKTKPFMLAGIMDILGKSGKNCVKTIALLMISNSWVSFVLTEREYSCRDMTE
jgi:hypothetical protein